LNLHQYPGTYEEKKEFGSITSSIIRMDSITL